MSQEQDLEIHRKLDSINKSMAELKAEAAGQRAVQESQRTDQERFWSIHMPRLEASIDRLAANVEHLAQSEIPKLREEIQTQVSDVKKSVEPRLNQLEIDNAVVKVKVGLWGGLAGAIALAWQIITQVWK